jgi:hypothetical protein
MRTIVLGLVLALVVTAGAAVPASPSVDSISRDARGAQPTGEHDPLGAPPTPRLYALGQTTIFVVGVTLLVVAGVLGAYTLVRARPTP